ncbi:MAG: hypothetical protein P8X57_02975 [Cyclobacteriaceae bacterium]
MKYLLICIPLLWACGSPENKDLPPEDKWTLESIEKSGGELYNKSKIAFRFREHEYEAVHDDGLYEYTRIWSDGDSTVRDVLNNKGFSREINGKRIDLPDSMAAKYTRSVNSVIYFALLPDGLNDPAVNRKYLGTKDLKGTTYHKVRVTFDQNGGGEDFEDEFIYWFNDETGYFDYMAYLYHTDGGGIRFREAYNPRTVNGIRFMDFNNFKPVDSLALESIDNAYMNGELEKLSVIELEDITVQPL